MKDFIEYSAMIENSKIVFTQNVKDTVDAFLYQNNGTEIDVRMSRDSGRSVKQNRLLHGCIIPAIQKCLVLQGMPGSEDVNFIKEIILKKPYLTVNAGTPMEYVRSTSSLSMSEFWEFCQWCLTLLVNIGGSLDQRGQELYLQIVNKYHLNKALDDKLK